MELLDPFTDSTGGLAETPSITGLYDALHDAEHQLETLRAQNPAMSLTGHYYTVGRLNLLLGNGDAAVSALQQPASAGMLGDAIRLSLAQALCCAGQYATARQTLDSVAPELAHEGRRYALYLLARATHDHDNGQWLSAAAALKEALALFDAEKLPYFAIRCELVLAAGRLQQRDWPDAELILHRVEERLKTAKILWYRPEWFALQARAALGQGNMKQAATLAAKGLGAVDNRADFSALPTLYRMLAGAYERGHERVEDARDARLRSVTAAKAHGTRLDVARALFELGWHYKLLANRPTLRARGSGFLYEADQLFQTLGMASPKHSGSTMPLL